jgi:adenine-specific DNA-methyltransferase
VIKYLGSKRLLVPQILDVVSRLDGVRTVLDLFSGTARVGHALKRAGYVVTANDHTRYAHVIAQCYVAADRARTLTQAERLLAELRGVPARAGWFTDVFCHRSRFFQPKNGARIEAMRDRIERWSLEPELRAVVLTALMQAADRVDSTCGVQMAYLKQWAARAQNDLELRMPDLLDGPGHALCLDARDAARTGPYDLAYLDPPYNQHKYLSNYHVWETLVRWDEPEVYGLACKRVDCREYKSVFNDRAAIDRGIREVLDGLDARHVLVSFSSEGHLSYEALTALLGEYGELVVEEHDYKRYVGAQIGIYNPSGEKVGRVSHLRNREYLFLVRRRAHTTRHKPAPSVATGAARDERG